MIPTTEFPIYPGLTALIFEDTPSWMIQAVVSVQGSETKRTATQYIAAIFARYCVALTGEHAPAAADYPPIARGEAPEAAEKRELYAAEAIPPRAMQRVIQAADARCFLSEAERGN